ncbi:MAG TPA: polysaccharide biosynthesis protein, partial [Patescibacteria group bacterium]|nr:polysaccharide biosynthesis protein [Patescibacteria group bacterium]
SSMAISETGHLYMLDMGEPIKILDLANDLIRSRGLRPNTDIKIVFTGLRPGERLTEDLLASDEGWRPTEHPMIREVISPLAGKEEDLAWIIERLEQLAAERKPDELVRVLKSAVQGLAAPAEEPAAQRGDEGRAGDSRSLRLETTEGGA